MIEFNYIKGTFKHMSISDRKDLLYSLCSFYNECNIHKIDCSTVLDLFHDFGELLNETIDRFIKHDARCIVSAIYPSYFDADILTKFYGIANVKLIELDEQQIRITDSLASREYFYKMAYCDPVVYLEEYMQLVEKIIRFEDHMVSKLKSQLQKHTENAAKLKDVIQNYQMSNETN